MVAIDPKRETHPVDCLVVRCTDDQGAVRVLSRLGDLEPAADLVDGAQPTTRRDTRRVTAEAGRESKRVRAARSERRLDQLRLLPEAMS